MVLLHTFGDQTHKLTIACWKLFLQPQNRWHFNLFVTIQIYLFKRMHINIRYACVCLSILKNKIVERERACACGVLLRHNNLCANLPIYHITIYDFFSVDSSLKTQKIFVSSSTQILDFVCGGQNSLSYMTCCLSQCNGIQDNAAGAIERPKCEDILLFSFFLLFSSLRYHFVFSNF